MAYYVFKKVLKGLLALLVGLGILGGVAFAAQPPPNSYNASCRVTIGDSDSGSFSTTRKTVGGNAQLSENISEVVQVAPLGTCFSGFRYVILAKNANNEPIPTFASNQPVKLLTKFYEEPAGVYPELYTQTGKFQIWTGESNNTYPQGAYFIQVLYEPGSSTYTLLNIDNKEKGPVTAIMLQSKWGLKVG